MIHFRYIILIFIVFSSCLEMGGGSSSENGLIEDTPSEGTSDSESIELSDEAMGIPVPIAKVTNPVDATLNEIIDTLPTLQGNEGAADSGADVLICNVDVDYPSACTTVTAAEDGLFTADLSGLIVSEDESNIFSIQTTNGEEGSTPVFISFKPGGLVVDSPIGSFVRYSTVITNVKTGTAENVPFVFNYQTGELTFTIEQDDGSQFLAFLPIEGGTPDKIPGLDPTVLEFHDQIYCYEHPCFFYRDEDNNIHRYDMETAKEKIFLANEQVGSRKFILCPSDASVITMDTPDTNRNSGAFVEIELDNGDSVNNAVILMKKEIMRPLAAACWNDSSKVVAFTRESESYKAYLLDLVDNTKNLIPKILFKNSYEIKSPVMLPDDSGFVYQEITKSGYNQIALYDFESRQKTYLTRGETDHIAPTVSYDGRFVVYQQINPDGSGSQLFINPFDSVINIQFTEGYSHYLPQFSRTENILTFRYGLPQAGQVGLLNIDLLFPE